MCQTRVQWQAVRQTGQAKTSSLFNRQICISEMVRLVVCCMTHGWPNSQQLIFPMCELLDQQTVSTDACIIPRQSQTFCCREIFAQNTSVDFAKRWRRMKSCCNNECDLPLNGAKLINRMENLVREKIVVKILRIKFHFRWLNNIYLNKKKWSTFFFINYIVMEKWHPVWR